VAKNFSLPIIVRNENLANVMEDPAENLIETKGETFTESSSLRNVVAQCLETLWLLTSWDFEGRIRFEVRDPFHPHANKVLMVQRALL